MYSSSSSQSSRSFEPLKLTQNNCVSDSKAKYIIDILGKEARYSKFSKDDFEKIDDKWYCKKDGEEVKCKNGVFQYRVNPLNNDTLFPSEDVQVDPWLLRNELFCFLRFCEFKGVKERIDIMCYHLCSYPAYSYTKTSLMIDSRLNIMLYMILLMWKQMMMMNLNDKVKDAPFQMIKIFYLYVEYKITLKLILHKNQFLEYKSFGDWNIGPSYLYTSSEMLKTKTSWLEFRYTSLADKHKIHFGNPLIIDADWTLLSHLVSVRKCVLHEGVAYCLFDDFIEESPIWKDGVENRGMFGKIMERLYGDFNDGARIMLDMGVHEDDIFFEAYSNARAYVGYFISFSEKEVESKYIPHFINPLNYELVLNKMNSDAFPTCVNNTLGMLKGGHLDYDKKFFLASFFSNIGVPFQTLSKMITVYYKDPYRNEDRIYQMSNLYKQNSVHGRTCNFAMKHGICPLSSRSECLHRTNETQKKKTKETLELNQIDPVSVHLYLNDTFEVDEVDDSFTSMGLEDDRTNFEWASSKNNIIPPKEKKSSLVTNTRRVAYMERPRKILRQSKFTRPTKKEEPAEKHDKNHSV